MGVDRPEVRARNARRRTSLSSFHGDVWRRAGVGALLWTALQITTVFAAPGDCRINGAPAASGCAVNVGNPENVGTYGRKAHYDVELTALSGDQRKNRTIIPVQVSGVVCFRQDITIGVARRVAEFESALRILDRRSGLGDAFSAILEDPDASAGLQGALGFSGESRKGTAFFKPEIEARRERRRELLSNGGSDEDADRAMMMSHHGSTLQDAWLAQIFSHTDKTFYQINVIPGTSGYFNGGASRQPIPGEQPRVIGPGRTQSFRLDNCYTTEEVGVLRDAMVTAATKLRDAAQQAKRQEEDRRSTRNKKDDLRQ